MLLPKICEHCQRFYLPRVRAEQRFCCNACGLLAVGEEPLREHSEDCPSSDAALKDYTPEERQTMFALQTLSKL